MLAQPSPLKANRDKSAPSPLGITRRSSPNLKAFAIYEQEIDSSAGCSEPREFYFECRDCHRPIKIKMGCGKRFEYFCRVCSKRWQRRTAHRYYMGSMMMKEAKFLTLTLRKTGGNMQSRLMSLWEKKKLLFKYLARAGYEIRSWCAVIEPPNHVHIIIDSEWIPKGEISALWRQITGDSFIVDIRPINPRSDPRKVFAYVTKYMTKAGQWEGMNLDLLKGFHLIGSWGLVLPVKNRRAICVCGSLRPLFKLDLLDYRAMIPSATLLPKGDWTVWLDVPD